MRDYSTSARESMASISKPESPVLLLEITHADLPTPVRVVNDNQDLVSNSELYIGLAFRATLPDDLSQGSPRGILSIDNIGRELTQWIEASGGGENAQVRMMQVMRSDPDIIEWEVTMELSGISITSSEVRGTLSFANLLDKPGIALSYRPENAPGLY